MNKVDVEQAWLAKVRLDVEGGGNSLFYDDMHELVVRRKGTWASAEAGGDFSMRELAQLIEAAWGVLHYIDKEKARRT